MGLVTEKSQITIPKHIRDSIGIRPGDEVEFEIARGVVVLHKKEKRLALEHWVGYLGKGKTKEAMAHIR